MARALGLSASTVRAIDLRYLKRWAAERRKPVLRQMGVDEIYLGKKQKFLTAVSNLESREPLWFGEERKRETLDEFFEKQRSAFQPSAIRGACVDMWEPFRQSIEQWTRNCGIVYDKFHIMQHAASVVDEVRRAEFFRKAHPHPVQESSQVTLATEAMRRRSTLCQRQRRWQESGTSRAEREPHRRSRSESALA